MTTSNRWYQLSVLQLMVAMAGVAILVWLNRPVPYRIDFDEGGTMPLGSLVITGSLILVGKFTQSARQCPSP